MKNKIFHRREVRIFFIPAVTCLLLTAVLASPATAQSQRATDGERATCKIRVNDKTYEPQLNQIGGFDRVSNIPPMEVVPIELTYPDGNVGEKVVISVEDGGTLDSGKKVTVIELDNDKKLSFNFQVTDDAGIYRITLRKGYDVKIVQLWVDSE